MYGLYAVDSADVNYPLVFGVVFGFYVLYSVILVAREAVTFVKGWNN